MRISDGVQTCALPISFPTICRSGQRRPALELIQRWKSGESWHRGLLLLSMATSAFISPTVGRRALFMMRWRGIIDLSRSEEHTSELQSLMRISYAVFCLKKKNKYNKNTTRLNLTTVHNHILNHTSKSSTVDDDTTQIH